MFDPKDNPALRAECDNCGAKLPPPDSQGNRTCQYCDAVYHVPRQGGPQVTVVVGNQTFTPPTVPTYDPAAAQRAMQAAGKTAATAGGASCLVSLIVAVVALAGIGIGLYSAFTSSSTGGLFGSAQAFRPDNDAILALPGEPNGPVNLALAASRYEGGTSYYVVKADATSGQTVWQSASLGDKAYNIQLAYDASFTLAADRTKVYAFRNTDGTTVWQGSLSDEIDTSCRGTCFTVVGSRVLAKSRDGVLQAFDTATGAPAWNRRLGQTSAQVVVTAQRIVVVDHIGSDNVVVVLNPADGTETGRLDPRCADPSFRGSRGYGPSTSDVALPVPFSDGVVFAWSSSPACVQKWDAVSGQMAWNTYLDGVSASSAPAKGQLVGPTGYYLSLADKVYDLDAVTGTVRNTWNGGEDLDLAAYLVSDTALVLQGKSTRGTTKLSLVVVDPVSGQQRTNIDVGAAEPADGPYASASSVVTSSEVGVSAGLDGTTLRVAQLDGDAKTFRFDTFDATNGARLGQPTSADPKLGSGSVTFGAVQWRGDRFVANVGNGIVVLDTANGTVASRWPG